MPRYPRTGPVGVVHLGLGAFHRAHQALVFDALLAAGDPRWGVLGVAMRNPTLVDAMAAQDGLYAVQLASAAGVSWQVGGAIWQTCVAEREAQRVVQAIAAATTRWITLTVTEKGYGPALAALLVQGLAARRAGRQSGLTLACCDNLSNNGRKLEAMCLAEARQHDPALAHWMLQTCTFPNSMVDRIVPAASAATTAAAELALGDSDLAALRTEVFWEWVIERRFADGTDADALASVGVKVVDDVGPFEEAKLRLLNGSHSAMACIGAVAALPVISDCIAQPVVFRFIHDLMTEEIGPLLGRTDWSSYRDALLTRFANPALKHNVHQIATDSTQKIPQRWVPAALAALNAGLPVERLAFCAAVWMRYCQGVDESGHVYALSDPMAEALQAMARTHRGNTSATFEALGMLPTVWGETLPHQPVWRASVITHLGALASQGVFPTAAQLAPRDQ